MLAPDTEGRLPTLTGVHHRHTRRHGAAVGTDRRYDAVLQQHGQIDVLFASVGGGEPLLSARSMKPQPAGAIRPAGSLSAWTLSRHSSSCTGMSSFALRQPPWR